MSTSISVLHTPPGAPTFTRSSASVTLASGCSGLRPACVPCRIDSTSTRCRRSCSCCCTIPIRCTTPIIYSPQSRFADRLRRLIDSVLQCKKPKSAPTTTSRTSRHRSSSNTSPTCKRSDCSSPLEELNPTRPTSPGNCRSGMLCVWLRLSRNVTLKWSRCDGCYASLICP